MKKIQSIIFSAFALTAALVSCSKNVDNVDNVEGNSVAMDNEIQITAMLDNEVATKQAGGNPLSSDTLTTANISAFYMNAYSGTSPLISITKSGDTYTTGKFTPAGGTAGKLEGSETWTDGSSTPYYWPAGDVKFMAISCSDGNQPAINIDATNGLTMTDFEVEDASGASYQTQKDYVAAVTTKNATTSFTVGLQFQHLLSRLSINMWAPSHKFTHTSKLEVVSFCYRKVAVKGNFSFTGANTGSAFYYINGESGSKCWSDPSTGQSEGNVGVAVTDTSKLQQQADVWNFTAEIPKATELQNSGSKLTDTTPWLNVIPGSNVADSLIVYIKLTPDSGDAYYKFVALDIAALATQPVEEYKPGYEYIYNLKVTGQDDDEGKIEKVAIELESVTVNKWNGTTAGTVVTSSNVGDNTLKDILENAESYSQINLLKSVTLQGTVPSGSSTYTYNYPIEVKNSCTLNLNAQAVTVAAKANDESNAPSSVFEIDNGVRFVITDEHTGDTKGSITNNRSDIATTALFTIKAATSPAIAGTVVIRGGQFNFDPSSYIEGTSSNPPFSGSDDTRTFTQEFTDPTTSVVKVRTTTVTLSSGTYTVSQTITNKNDNNNVNA